MESGTGANKGDEVQISTDQMYLTQDSEGQIIFVVHPDQQFDGGNDDQVVYIETPGNANEPLQGASDIVTETTIHATEVVAEVPVENDVTICDSVQPAPSEVTKSDDVDESEQKVGSTEKSVNETDSSAVADEADDKLTTLENYKSAEESESSDTHVEKNDREPIPESVDDENKDLKRASALAETPKKIAETKPHVSDGHLPNKNLQSPIIRDPSPSKPVNLKPMPESGPFILHEDDFEMDDEAYDMKLDSLRTNTKNVTRTTNGKLEGNIFENIQKKMNGGLKESDENVNAVNPTQSVIDKGDKMPENLSEDSSCRRSQRSKRPPEKFTDIGDSPSPSQKRPKSDASSDHLSYSPLKLNEFKPKFGKSPCKMYIRYQQTPEYSPSSMYRCDTCHFTTTRLENIVIHHKTHLKEKEGTPPDADLEKDIPNVVVPPVSAVELGATPLESSDDKTR